MANCADMILGDRFVCESCGLELEVVGACSCGEDGGDACSVPLQCCGHDMVKKMAPQ
ncbi:hypothetical protein ACFL0O_08370 [Thermodesulfobacteriota bacterium]